MSLPDLPQQNRKDEADFGVRFRRWWEANPMLGTFELKHTHGADYLLFSKVETEQIAFANMARSEKGILTRVAYGTRGAADYIGLVSMPVFAVIAYPGEFAIVPMEAFVHERDHSGRKSLTKERAREIAVVVKKSR